MSSTEKTRTEEGDIENALLELNSVYAPDTLNLSIKISEAAGAIVNLGNRKSEFLSTFDANPKKFPSLAREELIYIFGEWDDRVS